MKPPQKRDAIPAWVPFSLDNDRSGGFGGEMVKALVNQKRIKRLSELSLNELHAEAMTVLAEFIRRGEVDCPANLHAGIKRTELPALFEKWNSLSLVLSSVAVASFASLRHLSKMEHSGAFKAYPGAVATVVKDLNAELAANPDKFDPLLCHHPAWPVMYSPFPDFATDTQQLKAKLGHKDLNLRGKGRVRIKPPSFKTPANRLARAAYSCLWLNELRWRDRSLRAKLEAATDAPNWVKQCKDLPPPGRAVGLWVELGWQCILHHYGGHPENSEFQSIGVHRKEKATALKPRVSRPEACYIRDGIRENYSEAMRQLLKMVTVYFPP